MITDSRIMSTLLRKRTRITLDAALVLYTAWIAAHRIDEGDAFFHLSLGRAVLQARKLVVPEPTAFFDFDQPAVASEWLWSVLTYVTHQLGGYTALSVLGIGVSAVVAICVLGLVRFYAAAERDTAWAHVIAVAVIAILQCRNAVRPQLTLLIALPCFLVLARVYASAAGRRRLYLGLALALIGVVWAQLHGSFVLAPALFVLQVIDLTAPGARARLRIDGVTLALLFSTLLTSAYGAHVVAFIGSHAAGDAPRYIGEMARPSWAAFNPFDSVTVFAYLLLGVFGLCNVLAPERTCLRELLLCALGIALFATANRFIAEAGLLAVPIATSGARKLAKLRAGDSYIVRLAWQSSGALSAAWMLGATLTQAQAVHGQLGVLGVSGHAFALHAAKALEHLPDGSAVLTDYASSAPVGFVSAGRLRTFVDGRTPLYFDATDFAVARDMLRDSRALKLGVERYAAAAAVVSRDSAACQWLSSDWTVALVEPRYTTFIRQPAHSSISALRPCGNRYVSQVSCQAPEQLASDIARVRDLGAREFATFLEAEKALVCGGDAAAALHQLRDLEGAAHAYARSFQHTMVQALLANGEFALATERVLGALEAGDASIVNLLQTPAAAPLSLQGARSILERYMDGSGDDADLGVRVALAELCARTGDEDCARFHATRAAVRGRASHAIEWLAAHHSEARVRRDARRWLDVLRERTLATTRTP